MGKLVNYKKRSVELPSGCKDLVDVLRKAPKSKTFESSTSHWISLPKPEQIATHDLDHILRFMTRVLESMAKFTSLTIELPGKEAGISVYRHSEPGTLDLMVFVYRDTEEERAIRAFFARHHVAPTVDYLPGPVTPTSVSGLQYPLPQDAKAAANLVRDFLRIVHGVAEEEALISLSRPMIRLLNKPDGANRGQPLGFRGWVLSEIRASSPTSVRLRLGKRRLLQF